MKKKSTLEKQIEGVGRRPIDDLKAAKKHSDRRQYAAKAAILRAMINKRPEDFQIDSEQDGIAGITHIPTKFRFHLPISEVPTMLEMPEKKAGWKKRLGAAILAAVPLGGLGAYEGYRYMMNPYRADDLLTNRWQYWKTRLAVAQAMARLRLGEKGYLSAIDVPMKGGLHRVVMPKSWIHAGALKYLKPGWKPSIIAIPERGQSSPVTYRQKKYYGHLHQHPKTWTMHKDKYPAMSMALQDAKSWDDVNSAIESGAQHITDEGLPGLLNYVTHVFEGGETIPERKEHVPLREGNTVAPAIVLNDTGKAAPIQLEVADTEENSRLGLSGINKLPENYGMLFKRAESFWMPDMNFDLDMMYLSRDGTVAEIQQMKKAEPSRIYKPKTASAYAIEVPSGWCAENSISPGCRVVVGD